MSQENVDLIRTGYEHFRCTGQPQWELWDEEFVWDMSTFPGWPEKQTYHGREGYTEFMDAWLSAWNEWDFEAVEFIDAGDEVVQVARQRGKAKAGGPGVEMVFAQVWTIREGKVMQMRMYPSKAEALEAVGLSNQSGATEV